MILKQKILLSITCVLSLFLFFYNLSSLMPEKINYETYEKALTKYNSGDFQDAYHIFGKVSRFSNLKSAAILRQALCADKLNDTRTEINKYKELIRNYPNSVVGLRAKYLLGQTYYQTKKYKKAYKMFKGILTTNPRSDYAVASEYYLGSMETSKFFKTKSKSKRTKYRNRAVQYFKAYLKVAPDGRFAIYCVEKWVSLKPKLTNEDNLLIVKTYQIHAKYAEAQKYLFKTNINASWPYYVKNSYMLKNFSKVKYYTVLGLSAKKSDQVLINEGIDDKKENQSMYDAIDEYLEISKDPKTSISYLLSIAKKSRGYDYLLYKRCNNLPAYEQTACFNTLYYQFPDGQFAAEALANIFYDKVKTQKYYMAKKLGKLHLAKFPNTNSAPKVMFWLARVAQKTKNYEEERSYSRALINKYPDDYYAYRAFININRFRHVNEIVLRPKTIDFPYQNFSYGLITELAKVKDYGLISQLYNEDEFIKSWLSYLQGDFSSSARAARDAMAELKIKPSKSDPRWKLVYPVHYYNEIKQIARFRGNDPILILSIIREESYFNPKAKSHAGARGLMQLMPATAFDASSISGISLPNLNLLFDPYINIRLGNVYYAHLRKTLLNKDILAVLAYNGGIGSVSKWKNELNYFDIDDFIEQIPYFETQNYLKKVYKSYWNYIRIYGIIK